MERIKTTRYKSPVGELILGAYNGKLCLCDWMDERRRQKMDKRLCKRLCATFEETPDSITDLAISQLDEYFTGSRTAFSIPLLFAGTEFQNKAWHNLLEIPYGHTISYAEQAKRIGNPKAIRAVAAANAANPISIIVPCHRVIGSNKALTGYAGGLPAKQSLLLLEQCRAGVEKLRMWKNTDFAD